MKPTEEQTLISKAVAAGKDVKVIAGAGSGKSSTLRFIAQENKYKNFLAVCFNKANAEESSAHKDKPFNVEYKTFHSVAYRAVVNSTMRKKLHYGFVYTEVPTENCLTIEALASSYGVPKLPKLGMIQKNVTDIIQLFCNSPYYTIPELFQTFSGNYLQTFIPYYHKDFHTLFEAACLDYWKLLIEASSPVKIAHDVYLKIFQIQKHKITGFDVLLVDEAQDLNPCVEEIIRNNNHLQQVLVGDPAQSLYKFRGANNSLANFPYESFFLSTSFRFTPEIAEYANHVLPYTESPLKVIGGGSTIFTKSFALLCRTNAGVFEEVATFVRNNPEKTFYSPIDMSDMFSKLYHMQAVFFGETPRYPNKELKHITSKKTLEEALQFSDDLFRINRLGKVLKDSFGSLKEANDKFKSHSRDKPEDANVSISTIHKFKGLEADSVTISEDFITSSEEEPITGDMVKQILVNDMELANLLYVAVSRAKVILTLPSYLQEFFAEIAYDD